jgi:tetratricopeptide (TPR) repeat protein
MGQAGDYEALIRELLAGVAGGWSYGKLKGWWTGRGLNEPDLAGWLQQHGERLGLDAEIRSQLVCLADLNRGDLASVAADLIEGWEPQVDESEEWFDRGIELFELGRYEEAIASFDRVIKIQPDSYEAWCKRGIALFNIGRHEDTLFSCEQAIEINPDFLEAWLFRGITLDFRGRYEDAISSYNQVIEIESNHYGAWCLLGSTLSNLGRYEEAISCYERTIQINPDFHDAWTNQGTALHTLGRYEDAITSYNRALQIDRDNNITWNGHGNVLLRLGRYEDAIASYEQAIQIRSDYHTAWTNRGNVIGILHGYQPAINAYNQAFEHIHSSTHTEGWGELQGVIGRTHYKEGKIQLIEHQRNPQSYYDRSLTHYNNALQTLTREQFPKPRLETLIDTAKVHLAQRNTPAAHQCKTEALNILRDLLNAQPTFAGKKRLQIEFISLS